MLTLAQDPVQVPAKEVPHENSFSRGIGSVGLIKYFEGGYGMGGTLYVGPPCVLERPVHDIPAGTRVVPIAVSYIVTIEGKYLGTSSWMALRPADSDEGFEHVSKFNEPSTHAELTIYLEGDVTWGEVDQEDDIGLHQLIVAM